MSSLIGSKHIVYVFNDISLWCKYCIQHVNKFRSCYYKCMKAVFGYSKFTSVTYWIIVGLEIQHHCTRWMFVASYKSFLSTVDNITVLAVSQ